MKQQKEFLIIHNEIPGKHNDVRVFNQIKELSLRYKVTLLAISYAFDHNSAKDIEKYCKLIHAPISLTVLQKINLKLFYVLSLIAKTILATVLYKPNRKESTLVKNHNLQIISLKYKLKKILSKKDFDYIQVEHFYISKTIINAKTKALKILDFHNVHSAMENSNEEKERFKQEEISISKYYDLAICCSEIDKERLQENSYKNVLVVPNGVNSDYFKELEKSPLERTLLFVGKLTYKPNIDGLKFFFDEIYAGLATNYKINVIGKYDSKYTFEEERKLKNVNFTGYVENIEPYFENSIFICPLLDGGGTRQKILTSFALGAPVVSTTKGAEGIEYIDGENILIADTPADFIEKVNLLSKDKALYTKIKIKARKLAEDKYNWSDIAKNYYTYLEWVINESPFDKPEYR